jgi:hypothetical protein
LEQILGAAVVALRENLVRTPGGAVELAEAVENLDGGDAHLVAGISEKLGVDQGQGFFVKAEVEEGEGFFEFGFRVAKDHFQKSHWREPDFHRLSHG